MSDLAQILTEGVEALRDGDPTRAAELLKEVAESTELAAAPDLRDVRLRVLTLYTQALLDTGRASEARHALADARDLASELQIEAALQAVHELQERVAAAISEQFAAKARSRTLRALAERDVDDLLAGSPVDRHAAVLVERSAAALEVGNTAEAESLARRALAMATDGGDLRHQILALLSLARIQPADASDLLEEARKRTDEADAFDLLAFVVKAAKQAGIELTAGGAHGEHRHG